VLGSLNSMWVMLRRPSFKCMRKIRGPFGIAKNEGNVRASRLSREPHETRQHYIRHPRLAAHRDDS
jgi:hypothetical protein